MSTKYCVTKSAKKLPISLNSVLESFYFKPYFFKKKNTFDLLILGLFIENWAFSELIPKLI